MINILVSLTLALGSFFNVQALSKASAMMVTQSIQQAVDAAEAGGIVIIAAGNYQEQVTVSKPLTLQAQGVVKVNGFIVKADDVTINGFDITSPKTSNGFGVRVYNARCKIMNNYIHDTWWDGVLLEASSSGCLVSGNKFERTSQSGAEVRGSNHIIQSNEVVDTLQTPPGSTFTRSQGADADGFRFFGSGHQFIGNYIHDIKSGTSTNPDPHTDCFQSWKDTSPRTSASNILFRDNKCFLSWDNNGNPSSKIFQFGSVSNVIAENNLSRTRMVSIVQDGSHDIQFIHNTFIGDGSLSWGIELNKSVTNVTVNDNIFYHQENGYGYLITKSGVTGNFGHNCVYTTTRTPPGSSRPGDVWGLDPLFVDLYNDDFHLQPNSSCAGIGAFQSSAPTVTPSQMPTGISTSIPITATSTPTPTSTQIAIPWTATPIDLTPTPLPQTPAITPTSTVSPPPLPSGTSVITSVVPDTLLVGETGLVSVSLNGLPSEGVASVEFTCSYASDQISVGSVQIGEIFGNDPVSAYNNSQTGSFIYVVAASNGKAINTNGMAFTFTITGLQPGASSVECKANIFRANYSMESIASVPDSLTVILFSAPTTTPLSAPMLTGQVIAKKPVTISLLNPDTTLAATAMTNPDGSFNLIAPAGSFTVIASAEGYLNAQASVTLLEGTTTTLSPIALPAGDIDSNNIIDQYDALTVGMNYNVSTSLPADLSNDGLINAVDLVMLAENYRLTGVLNWQQP